MAKDMFNNVKIARMISPISPAATGTINSTIVDTAGFNSCTVVIASGAQGAGVTGVTPVVQESATTTTGDFTAVADADLIGLESGATLGLAANANKQAKIGYVGSKRYVRLQLAVTGSATGVYSAMAILGDPIKGPQSTQKT
jgi:hypothetical protein